MIWSDELTDRLRSMVTEGHSAGQIATALGLTRNTVCGKAHRIGVTLHGQKAAVGHSKTGRETTGNVNRMLNARLRKAPPPRTPINFKAPPPGIAASLKIPFAELNGTNCHWPGQDHPYTFCGHPAHGNRPYCEAHCRLAMRPAPRNGDVSAP